MKTKEKDSIFNVSKEDIKKVKGLKNTKRALKLIDFDKKTFALLIFIYCISTIVATLEAIILKNILFCITTSAWTNLIHFAIAMFVMHILDYVFDYVNGILDEKFNNNLLIKTKNSLYNYISTLSPECFKGNQTSYFVSRINDSATVTGCFTRILEKVRIIVKSIAYTIVLFTTAPILSLVTCLFYFIKCIDYKFLIPKRNALYKKNREINDQSQNIVMEGIRGAQDVKGLNMQDNVSKSYYDKQNEYFSNKYKIRKWALRRILPTNFFSFAFNNFIFLLLIVWFGKTGYYSVGAMLYVWQMRGWINMLFSNVFSISEEFGDIETSASRMMDLFDKEKFPQETFGTRDLDVTGNISFKNVSFSYGDSSKVLDDVSFDIEANKITAFVGKTGCGKSTTLSLISKFYNVTSGEILFDGVNIQELSKNSIRNNIAYVQQAPYIFNMTFKDNLQLVKPDATDEEIVAACKKAELDNFIVTCKDGYDTLIGENGINLSGGQKQRLAIARALLSNAKVIMFDESTSSLDNENQAKIQKVINNLSITHTIIVVAHRLTTIQNADKIIFMDNHKIIAEGTHKYLMENCEQYNSLYKSE